MGERMRKLHVLWTTGEREVAMKVIFPYLINAKANGWWDEINLIVWGPSAQLLAGDERLQQELHDAMDSGITTEACLACTDAYQVTATLAGLGMTVRFMGGPFTGYLNSEDKVITF